MNNKIFMKKYLKKYRLRVRLIVFLLKIFLIKVFLKCFYNNHLLRVSLIVVLYWFYEAFFKFLILKIFYYSNIKNVISTFNYCQTHINIDNKKHF